MESGVEMLKGLLCALTAVVLWALGVVLIKLLSYSFTVMFQNFFRYLSASIVMIIICLCSNKGKLHFSKNSFKKSLLPAFLVFVFQTITVHGVYLTKASIASFLIRLNVIFVAVISFFLFEEERKKLSSKRYLASLLLSMVGVAGLTLRVSPRELYSILSFDTGALIVLIGSVFWALYGVSINSLIRNEDPLLFTALVFSNATIMFLPAILFNLNQNIGVSDYIMFIILAISGILSIGIGNWMNMVAIKELGIVTSSLIQQATPFFAVLFSYIILDETLTVTEFLFGLLIVVGVALIIPKDNSLK